MTREEKYQNTSTFTFFNANPHNRLTSDCVFRAISTATEIDYNQVVMEMTELGLSKGYPANDNWTVCKYLEKLGWTKNKQPKRYDGTKYTGSAFCKCFAKPGQKIIANIGGLHIVAIVDKKVLDTWNSTDKCIGNYWTK